MLWIILGIGIALAGYIAAIAYGLRQMPDYHDPAHAEYDHYNNVSW